MEWLILWFAFGGLSLVYLARDAVKAPAETEPAYARWIAGETVWEGLCGHQRNVFILLLLTAFFLPILFWYLVLLFNWQYNEKLSFSL